MNFQVVVVMEIAELGLVKCGRVLLGNGLPNLARKGDVGGRLVLTRTPTIASQHDASCNQSASSSTLIGMRLRAADNACVVPFGRATWGWFQWNCRVCV